MKRLACPKDAVVNTVSGLLDGRTELGGASFSDYRVLLNTGTNDSGRLKRLGGWTRLGSGNEDLHDQLLGGQGFHAKITSDTTISGGSTSVPVDDVSWMEVGMTLKYGDRDDITILSFTDSIYGDEVTVSVAGADISVVNGEDLIHVTEGRREIISMLFESTSSYGSRILISGTKSRLYASTGSALNHRIIADGLGGVYRDTTSLWSEPRWDVAQLGDYILFTNGVDPVMAWPFGGPVIDTGPDAYRRWSAFQIYDLLGLGITAAGCVCAWNGFVFLGDVFVRGTRESSRVYWCDFNRPLEWAPGGESVAGYYDVGVGEIIFRIAVLGDTLRVYTDKAVHVVQYVGGDVVFRFTRRELGSGSMAFKWSLVNAGDAHFYMTHDSIVELREFDTAPRRTEWLYKSSGIIYNGLQSELLRNCDVDFDGFAAIDKTRCDQIAVGYDSERREIWFSWPTKTADEAGLDGVRRMTMMLSLKFGKATLVDHPFSAFCVWRPDYRMSVRDFTVQYCVCDAPGVTEDKEGTPLNSPVCEGSPPNYIVNATEDGTAEASADSLCYLLGDTTLDELCPACSSEPLFIAASVEDLTIKAFSQTTLQREVYDFASDTPAEFPDTSPGAYTFVGYPTLIQSEFSQFGSGSEKRVAGVLVNFNPWSQETPGQLRCQIATNNSPDCSAWYDSDPIELSCLDDDGIPEDNDTNVDRAGSWPSFAFYRVGVWTAVRMWVEGAPVVAGDDGPTEPIDCGFEMTAYVLNVGENSEGWK